MKAIAVLLLLPLPLMAQQPKGCEDRPEIRVFDFWAGDWQVTATGSTQVVGTSSVQLINRSCALLENWTGTGGGTGKSLNFYDASTQLWHQVWTDATGGETFFTGKYADDTMRFEGEHINAAGAKSPARLTFTRIDDSHVRQVGETSMDDGKTWKVSYDFTYTRK